MSKNYFHYPQKCLDIDHIDNENIFHQLIIVNDTNDYF